jgi:hypothetical protein
MDKMKAIQFILADIGFIASSFLGHKITEVVEEQSRPEQLLPQTGRMVDDNGFANTREVYGV